MTALDLDKVEEAWNAVPKSLADCQSDKALMRRALAAAKGETLTAATSAQSATPYAEELSQITADSAAAWPAQNSEDEPELDEDGCLKRLSPTTNKNIKAQVDFEDEPELDEDGCLKTLSPTTNKNMQAQVEVRNKCEKSPEESSKLQSCEAKLDKSEGEPKRVTRRDLNLMTFRERVQYLIAAAREPNQQVEGPSGLTGEPSGPGPMGSQPPPSASACRPAPPPSAGLLARVAAASAELPVAVAVGLSGTSVRSEVPASLVSSRLGGCPLLSSSSFSSSCGAPTAVGVADKNVYVRLGSRDENRQRTFSVVECLSRGDPTKWAKAQKNREARSQSEGPPRRETAQSMSWLLDRTGRRG